MKFVLGILNIALGILNIMMYDTRFNVAIGAFCIAAGVNLLMQEG